MPDHLHNRMYELFGTIINGKIDIISDAKINIDRPIEFRRMHFVYNIYIYQLMKTRLCNLFISHSLEALNLILSLKSF